MSLTLGEKLKQAREARGLSISEVAEQTRISALYLESIENDNYKPLPGGIFNKGFVKSYAKFVRIDDQEALQDYSRLLSEQGEQTSEENKTYRPEVLTDDQARSNSIPTLIFAVIILGALAFGVYYFVNYWQGSQNQPVANNNVNANRANSNANTNAAPIATPVPVVSELKFELKAVGSPISVSYVVDGKKESKLVAPDSPLALTAQQNMTVSYYKGFTPDKVQMTLNGKQIAAPAPPAKGNSIAFTINKENAAQILQSGAIPAAQPSATPAAR